MRAPQAMTRIIKWTPDAIRNLQHMWNEEGLTAPEIAKLWGCDKTYISNSIVQFREKGHEFKYHGKKRRTKCEKLEFHGKAHHNRKKEEHNPKRKRRRCLKCRRWFMSEWEGDRNCGCNQDEKLEHFEDEFPVHCQI